MSLFWSNSTLFLWWNLRSCTKCGQKKVSWDIYIWSLVNKKCFQKIGSWIFESDFIKESIRCIFPSSISLIFYWSSIFAQYFNCFIGFLATLNLFPLCFYRKILRRPKIHMNKIFFSIFNEKTYINGLEF